MRTLLIDNDENRHSASFKFQISGRKGATRRGYLFFDATTCTIFVMQSAACISANYTQEEINERNRLNSEEPIKEGDLVEINGVVFEVGKLGDYSDAGKLILKGLASMFSK